MGESRGWMRVGERRLGKVERAGLGGREVVA